MCEQPRTTRAATIGVECRIRAAALHRELCANATSWQHRPAANARRLGARNRAAGHLRYRFRLEDLELDARRLARGPQDAVPKRAPALRFLTEPEGARQANGGLLCKLVLR